MLPRLTAEHLRTGPLAFCSALGYARFRYFWLGQIASVLGQNMEFVAQSWLVLELTGSPLMLGLTGLSRSIPAIGLNLVDGHLWPHLHPHALRWHLCRHGS